MPEANVQKLFDGAVRDCKQELTVHGFVLGHSAGMARDEDQPFVCLTGPAGILMVNGHKLLLVQTVTGGNIFKACPQNNARIVVFKDRDPVAVLMAANDPDVRSLFEKMLAVRTHQSQVSRISPVAKRAAG